MITACFEQACVKADEAPLSPAVEAARKTHDEAQLQSLKTQLEAKVAKDSTDAKGYMDLARVNAYQENAKAMSLDDKNPRVWASLGRQYLMTPKMFGGDVAKAVESFQKSLALDSSQDETWVWLAKASEKQGDKTKARDAIQHAVELNPDSPWVKFNANLLER